MLKNRGMYFIHLNLITLLSKMAEIRHLGELANASVLGLVKQNLMGLF